MIDAKIGSYESLAKKDAAYWTGPSAWNTTIASCAWDFHTNGTALAILTIDGASRIKVTGGLGFNPNTGRAFED